MYSYLMPLKYTVFEKKQFVFDMLWCYLFVLSITISTKNYKPGCKVEIFKWWASAACQHAVEKAEVEETK